MSCPHGNGVGFRMSARMVRPCVACGKKFNLASSLTTPPPSNPLTPLPSQSFCNFCYRKADDKAWYLRRYCSCAYCKENKTGTYYQYQ